MSYERKMDWPMWLAPSAEAIAILEQEFNHAHCSKREKNAYYSSILNQTVFSPSNKMDYGTLALKVEGIKKPYRKAS